MRSSGNLIGPASDEETCAPEDLPNAILVLEGVSGPGGSGGAIVRHGELVGILTSGQPATEDSDVLLTSILMAVASERFEDWVTDTIAADT